jgi:hypothetical protein
MTTKDDTAEPTPGPGHTDGVDVVALPKHIQSPARILGPVSFGNDLPLSEQLANAQLTAVAFTAAHEAKEMGYDPIAALEVLPDLLETMQVAVRYLEEDLPTDGTMRRDIENVLDAAAEGDYSDV